MQEINWTNQILLGLLNYYIALKKAGLYIFNFFQCWVVFVLSSSRVNAPFPTPYPWIYPAVRVARFPQGLGGGGSPGKIRILVSKYHGIVVVFQSPDMKNNLRQQC